MGQFIEELQFKLKNSSVSIVTFVVRAISGMILGLTLALIGDEMMGYNTFSFMLVIVVTTAAILKISKRWTLARVLVFDLVCVLVAMLLRMYILIAPGA